MDSTNIYETFGFAILRSPLFPFLKEDGSQGKVFVPGNLQLEDIISLIDNKYFAEALLFSSEALYNEYVRIIKKGFTHGDRKAILKLFRYYLRMSSRCTPYGISAGVASVSLAEKTHLSRGETDHHRKHVQLNFKFINELLKQIASNKDILKQISFFSNNSWSITHKGLRYAQISTSPYNSSIIPANPLIISILEFASSPKTFTQLVKFVSKDSNPDPTQVEVFLRRLIEKDLLLPALFPRPFTKDFSNSLLERLPASPSRNSVNEILNVIRKINNEAIGQSLLTYQELVDIRNKIGVDTETDIANVNMVLSMEGNQLNKNIADEMIKAMSFLYQLRARKGKPRLHEFAKLFKDRYDDQTVSLFDVLDEQTGIGYPVNKLVHRKNKLFENLSTDEEPREETKLDEWDSFLLQKLDHCSQLLNLTDDDLQLYRSNLPFTEADESVYCSFSVIAENQVEIDNGNYVVEHLFSGGPSSLNNINHYANMDETILKNAETAGKWEDQYYKNRNIILAEINYMPRLGGAGNVMTRPNFYENEISIISEPSSEKNSISIQDLVIFHEDGQLKLKLSTTGQLVHPRSSSSYDYSNNHSISFNNFLSDLNFQNKVFEQDWSWGSLIHSRKYFPRVQYGKCVLSKQMWKVELSEFGTTVLSLESWKEQFNSYRLQHNINNHVYFNHERDLSLFLDLGNELCLEILYAELKANGFCWLTETLFVDNCFLASKEGRYLNTFILPLRKSEQLLNINTIPRTLMDPVKLPQNPQAVRTSTAILSFSSNDWLNDEVLLLLYRQLRNVGIRITAIEKTASHQTKCKLESPTDLEFEAFVRNLMQPLAHLGQLWNIKFEQPPTGITDICTSIMKPQLTDISLQVLIILEKENLLRNYEIRFATLITYALLIATKLYDKGNTQEKLAVTWNDLIENKTIEKKKLGTAYRKLIDYFMELNKKSLFPDIKSQIESGLSTLKEAGPLEPEAFNTLLHSLLHQLLPGQPTFTETVVFYDFLRQYLKQADQLKKHRKLSIV